MVKTDDLLVFITHKTSTCEECNYNLKPGDFITLNNDRKAICLSCSDLDHLIYLPSGSAALTRRSRKHSKLSAIVLKFSRSRKRNERQGILVEEAALEQAQKECDADKDLRAKRQIKEAKLRQAKDAAYVDAFASEIRKIYPGCPISTADDIAGHACQKYSGRVGRSAAAKLLDQNSICLAVRAHIRHTETNYDELLMSHYDRHEARSMVQKKIEDVIRKWCKSVRT